MSPDEGGEVEDAPPIDIKSRIAAFSQGTAKPTASTSNRPAPSVSRVGKPTLRKTPSTSQLLPAWQQQQQQKERQRQDEESLLKSSHPSATRSRANTGDESRGATTAAAAAAATTESASNGDRSRGNSPKLGVKGILALYGQQSQTTIDTPSSEIQSISREMSSDGISSAGHLLPSSRASNMEALRRPIPPPALPPRPRNSNALLSQTNTGSSSHSVSSNSGLAASAALASPPSSYTPYLRKGSNASLLGNTNGRDSPAPALPRRVGPAHSVEDLTTLDPSHSSLPSAGMRKLGSGPKWASSSSGNLTTQSETSGANSPTMIAPPVPPRASASVTNSPSSFVAPPPKRIVPQSPKLARNQPHSTTLTSHSSRYPSPAALSSAATTMASPGSMNEYISRSAKSSLAHQHFKESPSSPMIAPPPRHVDIRRMATTTSAPSSIRSAKRHQKARFKALQSGAIYTKDSGDAEQRYTLLFYRLLKDQQARDGGDSTILNKRTVVKLWKQSQLEDWFLAKVWEAAASTTQNGGIGKVAFTKAMAAIDYELLRRQTERRNRAVS